jgi:hypothetical protein
MQSLGNPNDVEQRGTKCKGERNSGKGYWNGKLFGLEGAQHDGSEGTLLEQLMDTTEAG